MAQSPKTSQCGASPSSKVRLPSIKTVQPYRLGLNLQVEVEAVAHALRWIAPRGDSQTTHAIILTDSMSLLQKVKSGMGSPDWNVSVVNIHLRKLLWTCRSEAGNYRPDRLAGKATITSSLLLGNI